MAPAESYLKPEVIRQVARLDLRAKFIVEGFLSGLHASPFQGFSVEFSEHRRYTQGDDPRDIDWLVFAKTDRYYVKKYQAETNLTGYLLMDVSESMGYTYRQELTKFDYSICLSAALAHMMIYQQDPVGLVTFGESLQSSLPARSKRSQLANIFAVLSKAKPSGATSIAQSLRQFAPMVRRKSLIILFSDLLTEPEPVLDALRMLKFAGHDIIIFNVLDEAEVNFPFDGMCEFHDPESGEKLTLDAPGMRRDYMQALADLRDLYSTKCRQIGIDFVPLDTSMQFDKALVQYLTQRRARF